MSAPETPSDFEKFVAQCFRDAGFRVELPHNPNQVAWDFKIFAPDGRRGAVQVKSRRSGALPQPQFNALSMYLTGPAGEDFDFGVNIVNTGFSAATLAMLENGAPETEDKFVYGAIVKYPFSKLDWMHHSPLRGATAAQPAPAPLRAKPEVAAFRVAVFTEKGGVGKTSVAAHLAGALLYQGRNAVLVDCDGQKNLSLLLGEGVNVRDKRGNVSTLVIEKFETFSDADYADYFIIYDCPPHFDKTDPRVFQSVTDTIIPIVLSPLSVLGGAQVIARTISQIRQVKPDMHFHVIVNQYEQAKTAVNYQAQLLQFIRHELKGSGLAGDPHIKFYNPDELSIRRSTIMLHWGMFLLRVGEAPHLAFESRINGATKLLGDFLALADSIEDRLHPA